MGETTRAEQLERQQRMALVQAALNKQKGGQKLTRQELAAWKRFEADQDQERGLRFIRRVPKKLYCQWSGRQTKILHDQADLYGLPLRGATIDVPAVVAWLHEFLAKWKHELAPLVKGGELPLGEQGLKEQLLREQIDLYRGKNAMLERQIEEKDANLLPRADVHQLLVRGAKILRSAGERLYKQCGEQAGDILSTAIADFEATIVAELDADKTPGGGAMLAE